MAKTIDGIIFNNLSRIGKGTAIGNVRNPDITSESDLQDYIDAGEEYKNKCNELQDRSDGYINTLNSATKKLIKTGGYDLIQIHGLGQRHSQNYRIFCGDVPCSYGIQQLRRHAHEADKPHAVGEEVRADKAERSR